MLQILGIFLFSQVAYHLIITFFWYWLALGDQTTIALIRDGLWIGITVLIYLLGMKYWKEYFKYWWKILWAFVLLLIFWVGISYFLFDKSFSDILIGVKYGFWWMIILLMAAGIGYFLQKKWKTLDKFTKWVKYSLVAIVILWWIWQWLKLLVPDVFFSFGYWRLDDFHYWENPPIYYLTWYEGTLRWQWLFSWPNNYWYFLVLFFPLIWYFFPIKKLSEIKKWDRKDYLNFLVVALWIFTILATLSRAAIVGLVLCLFFIFYPYLKKHKKCALWIGVILVLLLIGVSCWKWDSTVQHIQAKLDWVIQVVNKPLGYWLGSSWPAVHHSWDFLPENYFLQLMLDIWTLGFILWCFVMLFWIYKEKVLRKDVINQNLWNNEVYHIFIALQKWLVALFIMWLFLHVFEDSMVNYLFFVIYGISLWYLSALTHKSEKW